MLVHFWFVGFTANFYQKNNVNGCLGCVIFFMYANIRNENVAMAIKVL